MARPHPSICIAALINVALLAAYACAATGGSCVNPVQDACATKAAGALPELTRIAAQRGTTTDEIKTEFVNACEGQLQSDLDQALADLDAVADAGAGPLQIRKGNK